jgi:large subunit ribosomal protein L1
VGKANFEKEKLFENVKAFLATIGRLKPATAKGQYVKSIAVSSTMGPGVQIDRNIVQV